MNSIDQCHGRRCKTWIGKRRVIPRLARASTTSAERPRLSIANSSTSLFPGLCFFFFFSDSTGDSSSSKLSTKTSSSEWRAGLFPIVTFSNKVVSSWSGQCDSKESSVVSTAELIRRRLASIAHARSKETAPKIGAASETPPLLLPAKVRRLRSRGGARALPATAAAAVAALRSNLHIPPSPHVRASIPGNRSWSKLPKSRKNLRELGRRRAKRGGKRKSSQNLWG